MNRATNIPDAFNTIILRNQPVASGLLFGASVFRFMMSLVLPISNATKNRFSLGFFLDGIVERALFIGLLFVFYAARLRRQSAIPGAGPRLAS
ncbi:MAG: hypothetical protein ACLPY1_19715 [Terracidiphilus sp.]